MKNSYSHYTSISGLRGIIESENIWVTNIKYLNDVKEFSHAIDLIKEILLASSWDVDNPEYKVFKEYVDKLIGHVENISVFSHQDVFTCSFSIKNDLLSQWRGYCPSNNGYSLVVDIDRLGDLAKKSYDKSFVKKCVYEKNDKENEIRSKLNSYFDEYRNVFSNSEKMTVIGDLIEEFILLASIFKDSSFAEESETRIIIMCSDIDKINFREGESCLIPYVDLEFPRALLKSIIVGPNSNKEMANSSLEMFLEKMFTLNDVRPKTILSSIPYRTHKT